MICTTVMIVTNLAVAKMSIAHGQTTCVQPQVKVVNFLKDRREFLDKRAKEIDAKERSDKIKRIRRQKIKGKE